MTVEAAAGTLPRIMDPVLGPAKLAPIALFVYCRPEHTRRTVESLQRNALAAESDLYIFADAARHPAQQEKVREVRTYIESIRGFRKVTIDAQSRNRGLAKSVINGVTKLCLEFESAIVVEDDLITAPDFLAFMNAALRHYRDAPSVFSIGGVNYAARPPAGYSHDVFFSYRSCSWGWATWQDRWAHADWRVLDYEEFQSSAKAKRKFQRGGGDLPRMLAKQMAGKLDSWAIRWAYAHCVHDAVAVLPVVSRVVNIGFDGSGTHCSKLRIDQDLIRECDTNDYRFPEVAAPQASYARQIRRAYPGSFPGRLFKYIKGRLGTMRSERRIA
jgi:hypothetical protein